MVVVVGVWHRERVILLDVHLGSLYVVFSFILLRAIGNDTNENGNWAVRWMGSSTWFTNSGQCTVTS